MEKINVAELLKDCPKGMELDCALYDDVTLSEVSDNRDYKFPIKIAIGSNRYRHLTKTGGYDIIPESKCVIFPKGKTTWEGFQRPFKDGDILAYNTTVGTSIFIHRNKHNEHTYKTSFYVGINSGGVFLRYNKDTLIALCGDCDTRFATEEEKQKLFKAIKDNGYKWNAETKTLEKLVEPKFKVGDKVRHKNNHGVVFTITSIEEDSYVCGAKAAFWFDDQDDYELVPNKFDITTLKPFDKVLSRDNDFQKWGAELFSFYNKETKDYRFQLVGAICARRCIPFEGNQHLLGTTDDCDEYYKTWINEEE